MNPTDRIFLIDKNIRRRASVSHSLSNENFHVEPFENVQELANRWPKAGILLAYDDLESVRLLVDYMTRASHWIPLIAYHEQPDTSRIVEAVLEGATNYLVWPFDAQQASDSISTAKATHDALGPYRLREANARGRIQRLTPREKEVLYGVASGLSNRLIAERLSISPRTVEIHRANMLNKLGARHTSEAIRVAIESALVN